MTLALAAGGGALFAFAGLPAPWLSGAMIAVGVASLSGAAVLVPGWLTFVLPAAAVVSLLVCRSVFDLSLRSYRSASS